LPYLFALFLPFFLWATPFKVATYNVENLFDASYQGSEYEAYIPGKHNWNKRMVEIKLNHIAEVICDVDAAILGLQEIENEAIFKRLIQRLDRVGCAYPYSAITHKKGAPIQVALLSRYPIQKQKEIVVSYAARVRNILEVVIQAQGKVFTVFVNHWKSKAYQGYESKRIKYAKALQSRIASLSSSQEYIILGDFNSDYNAYLTLEKKLNDTHGKTAFSDVLQTKVEEHEIVHAKKGSHYTLWKELAVTKRWSHRFYGKKSSLDQIVLPATMFDGQGIDYVNNSFHVFKAKYLFTKRGYINRWRYKHAKHMAKGYSDHLPVFAYFDTKAYVKEPHQNIFHKIQTKLIEYLYSVNTLSHRIKLENVVVLLKRGNHAIVKQSPTGRGIFLYACAAKLEEGKRYDLLIESIQKYHGLKEVTTAYVLKEKGAIPTQGYFISKEKLTKGMFAQNDIVKNIEGVYRDKMFSMGALTIPLYFKKRKSQPSSGSKLKIHYAHLGYYKRLQLVLYSPKDFTVVE